MHMVTCCVLIALDSRNLVAGQDKSALSQNLRVVVTKTQGNGNNVDNPNCPKKVSCNFEIKTEETGDRLFI